MIDGLRNIDLNDYAVGFGVSHTESIYTGVSDTLTPYPYATRLFPSDFDDGVLFSRARGYGVRWLPQPKWEIGALARYQSLGFETDESATLADLEDRRPTIEVGPTIGWRGALRVDWTAFVDLLRNHHGASHLVRLSVPVQYPNGYLVPEIGLHRYSDDFVDYYFGVPTGSAAAASGYRGGAANGMSLGFAWGFKFAPNWLLTGRLGVEFYGSAIADSPIVDDRDQSSWSLNLTYDSTPFEAPDALPADELPRATVLLGASRASAEPIGGSAHPAEAPSLWHLDAGFRIARHQLLAMGIVQTEYREAGVPALDVQNLSLTYGVTLLRDRQKTLSVAAGVHFSEIEAAAGGSAQDGPIASGTLSPRPTIEVFASAHLAKRLSVVAKGQWLMLDSDRLSGRQVLLSVGLVHRTFERAHFGIGYTFNRMSLDLEDDPAASPTKPQFDGPSLIVTGAF